MKKISLLLLLIVCFLTIPVCVFGIINTGVSLKYETENLGDCISLTSGADLCQTIVILKSVIAICVVGILWSIYKLTRKTDGSEIVNR